MNQFAIYGKIISTSSRESKGVTYWTAVVEQTKTYKKRDGSIGEDKQTIPVAWPLSDGEPKEGTEVIVSGVLKGRAYQDKYYPEICAISVVTLAAPF